MLFDDLAVQERPAIRFDPSAIHLSLELSRKSWVVTAILPDTAGRMSRHTLAASDMDGLVALIGRWREEVGRRTGAQAVRVISIYEAGLDGFWPHRVLAAHDVESHVVDPASIPVPRKRKRAKTDRIDGELMLRVLMAWLRGEPRVCAMVRPPSVEAEDIRQLSRERSQLVTETVARSNRIKGLLFAQGISGFDPLARKARKQLETRVTGDGRPLAAHLKARILRALETIEALQRQIAAVAEALKAVARARAAARPRAGVLCALKGVGDTADSLLSAEVFFRAFDNRRQLSAYAGLAPTPFQSGSVNREQGVSRGGNPRIGALMTEIAWAWRIHQKDSALSQWFARRSKGVSKDKRKALLTAMARKLLIALWRFHTTGEPPEGAVLSSAVA